MRRETLGVAAACVVWFLMDLILDTYTHARIATFCSGVLLVALSMAHCGIRAALDLPDEEHPAGMRGVDLCVWIVDRHIEHALRVMFYTALFAAGVALILL